MPTRLIEISLLILLGLLGGAFVEYLTSYEQWYRPLFDTGDIVGFLMANVMLLVLIAFLLIWLVWSQGGFVVSQESIRQITNILVYLHVFSLFLPWGGGVLTCIPSGPKITFFLFNCLFIIVIFSKIQSRTRRQNLPRPITLFLFWLLVSWLGGILLGITGIDPIRANLSFWDQTSGLIQLGDAILVYYVIKNNNWGSREFERTFQLIICCGVVISLECLLSFYLGFRLHSSSVSSLGMFRSMFIGRHYYVAIIGMTMSFFSLYLWRKYGKRDLRYLAVIVCGGALVFSSLSRNMFISYSAGFVLFAFLAFKYSQKRTRNVGLTGFVICLILIIVPVVLSVGFSKAMEERSNFDSLQSGKSRIYRWARSLDIVVHNPIFGAGAGNGRVYTHADDVVPFISQLVPWKGHSFYERNLIYSNFVVGTEWATRESLHSVTLEIIAGLGLAGMLFVAYLGYKGWRTFKYIISVAKDNCEQHSFTPIFAVCSLVFSTSLSIQSTSKFESYWYFSLLFGFLNFIVDDLRNQLRFIKKLS